MDKKIPLTCSKVYTNAKYFFLRSNVKGVKAFTLVELIVVITILAILWTIAFITLQWYSKDARDSVRITDIKSAETGLELFQLNAWKYPEPDNVVSYTGWTSEIKQWILWEWVVRNIKLDKILEDPLTNKNYVYSVFWKWLYYQIAADSEDIETVFIQSTYAAEPVTSIVRWNYKFDPTLPSLILVPSSVTSSWIFDPNVCFVVDWGKNTLNNCVEKKSEMSLKNFDDGLVAYWDMESYFQESYAWVDNVVFLKDLSWNNYNIFWGTSGWYMTSTTTSSGNIFVWWINWKGIYFNNNIFKYYFSSLPTPIDSWSTSYVRPDFWNYNYANTWRSVISWISFSTILNFDYDLWLLWNYKRIISFGKNNNWYIDSWDVQKSIDSSPFRFQNNGVPIFSNWIQSYITFFNPLTKWVEYWTEWYVWCGWICTSDQSSFKNWSTTKWNNIMVSNMNFQTKEICIYINWIKNFCYPVSDWTINRLKEWWYRVTKFSLSNLAEPFAWTIYDAKIYNRALSDDEILQQARIAGF